MTGRSIVPAFLRERESSRRMPTEASRPLGRLPPTPRVDAFDTDRDAAPLRSLIAVQEDRS